MTSQPSPEFLAKLHGQCFTTPRPWNASEFESLLGQPHVFLVSLASGFALGRAVAGEVELLTIAVAPTHRRSGTGRALMARFETGAITRGATESFLEVADDNEAAIALYATCGYSESGRRKNYYTPSKGPKRDALILRKVLK